MAQRILNMFYERNTFDRYDARSKPATQAQLNVLNEMGVPVNQSLTYESADRLIKQNWDRWKQLAPTPKQEYFLQMNALWEDGMNRGEADALIKRIKGPNSF
jgi:hypothetical protein